MRVELLVVPGCPHAAAAREVLMEATGDANVDDMQLVVTVVETDEQAIRRGFVGSPTFLLNGIDPFAASGGSAGLTCRVYRTPAGLSGVPEVAALRDALVAVRTSAAGG